MQKLLSLNNISLPSPVTKLSLRGREFYIKRDELLHHELSGNKFRKLYQLIQTPSSKYSKIISYGGTQSNAMLAIAYLAHEKGWQFDYYSKPIALHVKSNPQGNYKKAREFGMNIIEIAHGDYEKTVSGLFLHVNNHEVLIPQGGADKIAQSGVAVLADEIKLFQEQNAIDNLNIITPSGTGTTAYYLAKEMPTNRILTTPVVGDAEYLYVEMKALGDIPNNLHVINTDKRYRFAKPYREYYQIYQELKEYGIEFDLIYAPKMWLAFLENIESFDGDFLYVHSGGVSGNETMLQRYKFKGIV
ncbi:MAG: pyridoxal-phosphate dependent enzyme [Campylobacterota bacterium]|nr:pyridoxal-phosphate dependent enzyme [Campylobacterota bacterium]